MKPTYQRLTMAALALMLAGHASVSATAQQNDPEYQSWGDGDTDEVNEMVRKLRDLIEAAERARAADPRFLNDLKDLANSYDQPDYGSVSENPPPAQNSQAAVQTQPPPAQQPKPAILINDDFKDGDFTQGVNWTIVEGQYWIEDAVGLRSVVRPAQAAPAQPQRQGNDVASVVGGILDQVLSGGNQSGGGAQTPPQDSDEFTVRSEIRTRLDISNSFGMRVQLTSREGAGAFSMGPFQTDQASYGYKLIYQPGAPSGLRMVRHSPNRTTEIAAMNRALNLEDNQFHKIDWVRKSDGTMTVTVDDQKLLEVQDTSFRDPFNGFAFVNEQGDYAVRSVALTGLK